MALESNIDSKYCQNFSSNFLFGIEIFDKHLKETPNCGLGAGDVLEILGQSGTGKTELLYDIILTSIMPNLSYPIIKPQILDEGFIHIYLIDLDMKFSFDRFKYLFEQRIELFIKKIGTENENNQQIISFLKSEDFKTKVFSRLFVTQPNTILEFVASLHKISDIKQIEPSFKLLIIENISSFYFEQRQNSEKGNENYISDFYSYKLPQLIKSLLHRNSIALILTRQLYFNSAINSVNESLKYDSVNGEYMGRY